MGGDGKCALFGRTSMHCFINFAWNLKLVGLHSNIKVLMISEKCITKDIRKYIIGFNYTIKAMISRFEIFEILLNHSHV